MQNHFSTKKRGTPWFLGIRGALAVFLFSSLLWANGANAAAMSGTYTIGSGGNYSSFSAAVADLNTNGVSGAVLFQVSAATFTETVKFNAITGASATNTITFQGKGRLKTTLTSSGNTVNMSTSPYTSYVTFDNMTIASTGNSPAWYGYYDVSCGVTNCNVTVGTYSSYTSYPIESYYSYNFTLKNCRVVGGEMSWYNYGSSSSTTVGYNNIINNRFIGGGIYGWYVYYTCGNNYQNNVFDSAGYSGGDYDVYSIYESGATYNANKFYNSWYLGAIIELNNYYSVTLNNVKLPFTITNNIWANATEYGLEYIPEDATAPCIFAHNTIFAPSGCYYGILAELYSNGSGTQTFSSNIIYSVSPLDYGLYMYMYPGYSQCASYDGNDLYVVGGTYAYFYNGSSSGTYGTYAAYQAACQSTNSAMEAHGTSVAPTFLNPAKNNFGIDTTKPAPTGVYVGVNYDINGKKRCTLFPTAGAQESPYGKSKPIVKFYIPTNVYPNSPTTFYQTGKPGDPKVFKWYLQNSTYSNLTLVSTAVNFTTSALTLGTNCIKLVTLSCGGNDSFQQCFTVSAPSAVPGTDFIANLNTIQQGGQVSFTDLSTNGPTKWLWQIQPDSIYSNGVKVPTTTQYTGSPALNTTQNPTVQFNFGGEYKVCLTAYNGIGKGATVCKTNYVNVIPATNLGTTPQTLTTPNGYIYDNGGPNANYTYISSPYIESVLIAPCADSIYLTFSQFDTYCGYDYVRLYNGKDKATGTPLWNSSCSSTGYGYGPGYTGGATHNCAYICTPNITKPDTFKAGHQMYLEMDCAEGSAPGFSAYYWTKPRSDKPPVVSFTTSNLHDSVCVNQVLNFTNTTKIDPTDVPTFEWDLDGSFTDGFECVGTCATALWPYFLPGTVTVTLIGTNCGGPDTATQNIIVYNPAAPKAAFSADNTTPTTNDLIYFSSNVVQCVDDYKWTISKSTTHSSSAVGYVNGTSPLAQNPQVVIGDTGYFDVKLYVDNSSGSKKDSLTKLKYLNVRNSYCIPSVATRVAGIGMTQVVLNTINNTMAQATADYINYVTNQSLSTNLAIGATYKLTVARDPNTVFDPINRDVWIDWNQDGSFSGPGETVLHDSNSVSQSYTANVKIPKTAKLGATVMRVATNLNIYSNKPCGQNEFGAYQDYRIYVTPYNILPVITLKGHHGLTDTIKVEQGYPYTEPGDSASSFLYGNITKNIVVTSKPAFNAIVPGTYTFSYNVTDSAGNKAITQYRVVQITPDKTAPALVVATPDTTYIEVTKTPIHPVPVPKVISANDLVDGNLISSVVIDSGIVQTNIVGTYVVSYTVSDLSNNTATVYRVIIVIDTIKPVLALNGKSPMKVEVYTRFVDPGVTPSDVYYTAAQLIPHISASSNVDTAIVGTYTVKYTLTDPSGNVAIPVTRIVNVVDTLPPTVTLNGPAVDSVAVFSPYTDPGITYSDNYNSNPQLTVVKSGSFVTTFLGKNPFTIGTAYTIVYTVTDKSGNKTSVTRIVKVQDRIAPVITLKGQAALSMCRWFPYVDAGYNVSDNYNTVAQLTIDTVGTFYAMGGTTMYGYFSLGYTATDKSGNTGFSGYRYIQVNPETSFGCQSGIAPDLSLDKSITIFPNPNNGTFTISANLPTQEKVRMSVTNMVGQEIAVIHDGYMGQNSFQVDLGNQASGVYLLNIVSGNQTITKRIVVTK